MSVKTVYRQISPKRRTPRVAASRRTAPAGGFETLLARLGLASATLQQHRRRAR